MTTWSPWERQMEALAPKNAELIRTQAEEWRDRKRERDEGVTREISGRHGSNLAAFDHVIFAMEQHGLLMLQRIDQIAEDQHSPVRSAMVLLLSSGTMTVQEIRLLMVHGYWAGAAARWRALHELAITARLIAEGGPPIAQRYLDHGLVVQTRRLAEYREKHGVGPVSDVDLERRLRESGQLEIRHELPNSQARFRGAYGWAIPLLPLDSAGKHLRPTFDLLEGRANFSERRLLVVTAHGLVHNDSAGVRSAVLMEDGYSTGPLARFTATVARPTLESIVHLVAATHVCFEPDLESEFARVLTSMSVGLLQVASEALAAFEE